MDAIELILDRNAFFKWLHYLSLAALLFSIILIIILSCLALFLLRNPTAPIFFATDSVGRLIHIIPVDQPNMPLDGVIDWVKEGVEAANSFNYLNYPAQLQAAQKYFTNYGWAETMKALTASDNLLAVKERKLITIAKVVQKPKLISHGLLQGALAWKFEMPVLLTVFQPPYDEKSQYSNALIITVLVQRQNVLNGYKGLGIIQMLGSIAAKPTRPSEITASPTG